MTSRVGGVRQGGGSINIVAVYINDFKDLFLGWTKSLTS